MVEPVHPDERAFLTTICADPEDDTSRLVYADWLDEHGQPERAEFLRVECEAARIDRDSPAYPQLVRRSSQLSARNAARWFGPLADGSLPGHVITSRGFVDCVVLPADGFRAHADTILAYAPLLRGLHVTAGGDWRAFFASPRMPAIRSLSFADDVFTADAAGELAASENAATLVELDLDRQCLGVRGWRRWPRPRCGGWSSCPPATATSGTAGPRHCSRAWRSATSASST